MPVRGDSTRSEQRRAEIIDVAIRHFADRGLYGTSTQQIADEAGISQPYVYRLFDTKVALFVAAIERVSELLVESLIEAADTSLEKADLVDTLASAHGELIRDDHVLRFLLQANCAVQEPSVIAALQRCYARQVDTMTEVAALDARQVRTVIGSQLLGNVVRALNVDKLDEYWARALRGDEALD